MFGFVQLPLSSLPEPARRFTCTTTGMHKTHTVPEITTCCTHTDTHIQLLSTFTLHFHDNCSAKHLMSSPHAYTHYVHRSIETCNHLCIRPVRIHSSMKTWFVGSPVTLDTNAHNNCYQAGPSGHAVCTSYAMNQCHPLHHALAHQ